MMRYLPVLIGAIVLFLLSIAPAFGQQEEVRFIDPDDINPDGTLSDNTPDDQEWARQGGRIGLLLFSDSLDTPVKRVLIPSIDATMIGTGDVRAHTATITKASSGVADSLSVGDYVLIGQNTVRMVESVSGRSTVTLDQPFARGISNATIYRINDSVTELGPWEDNYSSYAMAEVIGRNDATYRELAFVSRYNARHGLADSDVGKGATTTPLARISGSPSGTINTDDVLVVKVSGSTSEAIPVDDVSGDRIEMDDIPGATSTNPLGLAANETAYLVYWAEERNETGSVVTVRSRVRPGPVTVVLTETTPRSGEFVLEIETVAPVDAHGNRVVFDADASPPTMPVNPRDAVTLAAADASATLQVESTPPTFSALSPEHNTPLRDNRPEVSARVTDSESGLKGGNIYVIFRVTEGSRTRTVELRPKDYGDVEPIPGGFEIRQRLPGADAPTGDAVIEWWVKATDNAGNVGYSDNEASSIVVDGTGPSLLRAETGRHWDAGLYTGDSDDKTEYRASRADPTSILVVFDEHLDDTTVTAADFEVDGAPPIDAKVCNVKVRDDSRGGDGNSAIAGDDVRDVGLVRGYVFLAVGEMEPDARPRVELVGAVTDLAGNRNGTGRDGPAVDRNAPTLAITHAGLLVRPNSSIPVTATFSEPVSGFASSDIGVVNGTAGNLIGSNGDRVYSFDVTPTAIGEVTVDIPAGVSRDIDGNGNTAAPQLSLGIPYDDDHDGTIDLEEAIAAVMDYFSGTLTLEHAIAVIQLYFGSPG